MVKPTPFPLNHTRLRSVAEASLKQGTAPSAPGALGTDALALLYKLASTPESAGDGLKLLHELQTHQVELDLQRAQLEANEREFAEDLARYKALYEFAPIGYFIVDLEGRIIEANQAGAELFGIGRGEMAGRRVETLIDPESRSTLAGLLKKLYRGGPDAACEALAGDRSRRLHIRAKLAPAGDAVLITAGEHAPPAEV